MKTEPMPKCPQCGGILPPSAPAGLCPNCLMALNLKADTVVGGDIPAAPPPIAQIAPLFPQLEVLELLGQGGMGMVYKARQPQLDRFVALKILSPELGKDPAFAERFTREARALARLNHPNIVGVYDFGTAGGFYFFLMEFVDGMNLWQLEQARKLAPEDAFAIIPKICDALQFAHDEGIVHRDIKPANILIDKKGRVKIADFGLAKLADRETKDFTLTQSRMAMGTPHYMSPEQFEDSRTVDHRADIYSLGVVFYEMLTGQLPLGRFAPPSEKVQVDVRLDEIVLRSLERDVERRYQHASDVKTAVENVTGKTQDAPAAGVKQIRFRDLPAGLKHTANKKTWLLTAGYFLCLALGFALLPMQFHDKGFAQKLAPQSRAYKSITLTGVFSSSTTVFGTSHHNETTDTMPLCLEVEPNDGPKLGMTINLPDLRAQLDNINKPVFDREVLVSWMRDALKINTTLPEVQTEIDELVSLVKSYSFRPPATRQEFELNVNGQLKHFAMREWSGLGGRYDSNWKMLFVLALSAAYLFLVYRIRLAARRCGRKP